MRRANGSTLREVAVCCRCEADLNAGASLAGLVRERGGIPARIASAPVLAPAQSVIVGDDLLFS